jgi:single-stranded DNA-specific DHH superfamily exonuclease
MKPEFLAGYEKRFFEFISGLNEKDKIALISHTDADGLCSAVIAGKVIKPDYTRFFNYKPGDFDFIIDELKKRKINKVIMLDFVTDNLNIKEIEKFTDILIIDHHIFKEDLNSEKTVFIKAESRYPACYMCYYLFSKIQKIPGWIAALGILGDNPHKYNQNNCDEVCRDFELDNFELDNIKDLWKNLEDINFALAYFGDDKKRVYDILIKSKEIGDLEFGEYSDRVREEFYLGLEKFEKEKEVYGNLIVFHARLKYPIKYLLINKISSENKDKTFAFIKDDGGYISVSLRSQKINCRDLLRVSMEGIPDSDGGGHSNAAGGSVPKKYLSKFKESMINAYREVEKNGI